MQLKVGNLTHALSAPAVAIRKVNRRTDASTRISTLETWEINALLTSSVGANDLDDTVKAVKAAYADGADFRILLPDGSQSAHSLLSGQCLGGTRIVNPPSFPDFSAAAGVTYLRFTATVEGEVIASNPATSLLSFEESLSFTGGGPLTGFIEVLNGPPIEQTLRQQTVYRATQTGSAVGYGSYPAPAAPLWPANEIVPSRRITPRSPKRKGNTYTEFPVSWSYEFHSASALSGTPHFWT